MNQFKLTREQRARLLAGDYHPLEFAETPEGCEPGAVYVLSWKHESATVVDKERGIVARTPAVPAWFLTVKSVKRQRKGTGMVWLVRFDVTDRRDPDLFLRRGGGYQSTRVGAVDDRPIQADPKTIERARAVWREQALLRKEQLDRDRQRRSQVQRLQEVKRRARLSGVDVSTDERVIEERISRMERKVDREPNGGQEAA